MKKERVRDWMTDEVIAVDKDATLPYAHQIMMEKKIRRLPVVDGERRPVGIVTLGDVRSAQPSPASSLSIWEMNYLLSKLAVNSIMTADPVTIQEEATIGEAAACMLEQRIGGLPVVDDNGKLSGIITESDIFRMVVRHEWLDDYAKAS